MAREEKNRLSVAHLYVASSFVIAQPLFDLLSRNAEFFVIRNSEPIDIWILTFTLSFLFPGVMASALLASRSLSCRLNGGFQYLTFALLGAGFALQVFNAFWSGPGAWLVSGACGLGILASLLYRRFQPARLFMTALTPSIILFPGLFLFHSPIYHLLFPKADPIVHAPLPASSPPIVMVLFDELPLYSLLDAERSIDDVRYPHFAALARNATWFRNATTVSSSTAQAVPAILTGNYPNPTLMPTAADHPRNLFTWIGGAYDVKAFGTIARLCPATLCPHTYAPIWSRLRTLFSDVGVIYPHVLLPRDLHTRLPAISQQWMDFGRKDTPPQENKKKALSQRFWNFVEKDLHDDRRQLFSEFIRSITPTSKPTLFFLHILLPHSPYNYFPSGKRYTRDDTLPGLTGDRYLDDEWAVTQLHRRHLLQVGFVDTLLGQLIAHLRTVGLYDPALLIITADHGVSFNAGGARRELNDANAHDILPVPLFIKAPYQQAGVMSEAEVETIDILPTMAAILKLNLPWAVDGQTAWSPQQPQRKTKTAFSSFGKRFELSSLFTATQQTLQRQVRLFGARTAMTELYKIGPYKQLIGRSVHTLTTVAQDSKRIEVDHALANITISPQTARLPAYLTGRINPPPTGTTPRHVAIAVNDTIQAVTRTWTFSYKGEPGRWSTVINEQAFHPGVNTLDAFIIIPTDAGPILEKPITERYFLSTVSDDTPASIESSQGKSFPVVTNALEGWVDNAAMDQDVVSVSGWAADTKHGRLPEQIVAFLDGAFLFSVTPRLQRPDVAAWSGNPALEHSGFFYQFPATALPYSSSHEVRFFALSRMGVASELLYREDYPWRKSATGGK